jgi:hypothetical protein
MLLMPGTATNLSLGAHTKRTYYCERASSLQSSGVLLDIVRDITVSATSSSSKVLAVDTPLTIGT